MFAFDFINVLLFIWFFVYFIMLVYFWNARNSISVPNWAVFNFRFKKLYFLTYQFRMNTCSFFIFLRSNCYNLLSIILVISFIRTEIWMVSTLLFVCCRTWFSFSVLFSPISNSFLSNICYVFRSFSIKLAPTNVSTPRYICVCLYFFCFVKQLNDIDWDWVPINRQYYINTVTFARIKNCLFWCH